MVKTRRNIMGTQKVAMAEEALGRGEFGVRTAAGEISAATRRRVPADRGLGEQAPREKRSLGRVVWSMRRPVGRGAIRSRDDENQPRMGRESIAGGASPRYDGQENQSPNGATDGGSLKHAIIVSLDPLSVPKHRRPPVAPLGLGHAHAHSCPPTGGLRPRLLTSAPLGLSFA